MFVRNVNYTRAVWVLCPDHMHLPLRNSPVNKSNFFMISQLPKCGKDQWDCEIIYSACGSKCCQPPKRDCANPNNRLRRKRSLCLVYRCTSIGFWWAFIGNANCRRAIFASGCVYLCWMNLKLNAFERVSWMLYQWWKVYKFIKFLTFHCTLPPQPVCQTLLSVFGRSRTETTLLSGNKDRQ